MLPLPMAPESGLGRGDGTNVFSDLRVLMANGFNSLLCGPLELKAGRSLLFGHIQPVGFDTWPGDKRQNHGRSDGVFGIHDFGSAFNLFNVL